MITDQQIASEVRALQARLDAVEQERLQSKYIHEPDVIVLRAPVAPDVIVLRARVATLEADLAARDIAYAETRGLVRDLTTTLEGRNTKIATLEAEGRRKDEALQKALVRWAEHRFLEHDVLAEMKAARTPTPEPRVTIAAPCPCPDHMPGKEASDG